MSEIRYFTFSEIAVWKIARVSKRFSMEKRTNFLYRSKDYTPKISMNNKFLVCCYHVTYAFQSESTLYSCLNVKELLALNRYDI